MRSTILNIWYYWFPISKKGLCRDIDRLIKPTLVECPIIYWGRESYFGLHVHEFMDGWRSEKRIFHIYIQLTTASLRDQRARKVFLACFLDIQEKKQKILWVKKFGLDNSYCSNPSAQFGSKITIFLLSELWILLVNLWGHLFDEAKNQPTCRKILA